MIKKIINSQFWFGIIDKNLQKIFSSLKNDFSRKYPNI